MIAHASIPLSNRLHHLQTEEVVGLLDVDVNLMNLGWERM
jgi:hypothetical protein